MFSHVILGATDSEKSKKFYDVVFGTLGKDANHGNGSTIGFAMQITEQADAFHAAGVANGGTTCEDPPG
jgi:catechol 2,3-dioxygenase-like lactoylglutathione lyase family enzyme